MAARTSSGYTIIWKDLLTSPEFKRLVRRLRAHLNCQHNDAESRALGCLTKLWLVADSHIRDDDTLDMGADEIDEFLGIEGISQILGANWLVILDADHVQLPNWLAHNGTEAKKRARSTARMQKYRAGEAERTSVAPVTDHETPERHSGDAGALHGASPPTYLPTILPTDRGDFSLNGSVPAAKPPKPKPSRRAPPEFSPDLVFARTEVPDMDVEREIQKFRDCEFRTPKSDWPATWRRWVRKAREDGSYTKVTKQDPTVDPLAPADWMHRQ